ncbi:Putative uncharacterized protein [Propionibacterium freudenreichii]|nr:Putative uncharacterized protein [Propionibacterium freudenreichii]SCQ46442.1 Hypothetical protein PFR_JS7-1_1492 [Propionibacterium freudenreichii]SCQ52746.1 Hypothetical protein PFR_JS7-2_1492 [Propionibacterium freudenreichii]
MVRNYHRKTSWRPRDERQLSVRAEHRDSPDLGKLTELLIRLTLQETGQRRIEQSSSPRAMTSGGGSE